MRLARRGSTGSLGLGGGGRAADGGERPGHPRRDSRIRRDLSRVQRRDRRAHHRARRRRARAERSVWRLPQAHGASRDARGISPTSRLAPCPRDRRARRGRAFGSAGQRALLEVRRTARRRWHDARACVRLLQHPYAGAAGRLARAPPAGRDAPILLVDGRERRAGRSRAPRDRRDKEAPRMGRARRRRSRGHHGRRRARRALAAHRGRGPPLMASASRMGTATAKRPRARWTRRRSSSARRTRWSWR